MVAWADARLLAAEPADHHHAEVHHHLEEVEPLGSREPQHDEGLRLEIAERLVEELDRSGVGPVEIFEDQR